MANKRGTQLSGGHGGVSQGPCTLRILVADDERDSVLTLMMLLRDEGHEVRGVHSGGQAVARQIKSRTGDKGPMLIGISGEYKQGSDRILSQIIGFDHYLVKPYEPNALLALLDIALPELSGYEVARKIPTRSLRC